MNTWLLQKKTQGEEETNYSGQPVTAMFTFGRQAPESNWQENEEGGQRSNAVGNVSPTPELLCLGDQVNPRQKSEHNLRSERGRTRRIHGLSTSQPAAIPRG